MNMGYQIQYHHHHQTKQNWIRFHSAATGLPLPADTTAALLMIIFSILLLPLPSTATSQTLSDELPQPHLSTGRTLLQAQQGCPVNFENLNYTIITSRCRGPKYPSNICCEAFKDFACPYADYINDQHSSCATTMFSYINLYGKYPPGLFANECRDSKRGLECSDAQSATPTNNAHSSSTASTLPRHPLPLILLSALLLLC